MKKSLLTILCTLLSVFSWAQGTTAGDGSAEAYAVLTDNQDIISQDATGVTYGKTLTFYYDDQKSANNGMSVGPFIYNNGWEGREWDDYASQITTVVFDESFKNYTSLTSTTIWFFRLSSLTSIQGIENLNTSNVTEMNYMFYECSSLRELDLSHFDTSNVGDMRYMFYGCTNMTSFNLKNFNTSKVFEMGGMFRDCTNLSELDISSFDTQNVTDMQLMFSGCANLTTLDLSSFNTANVSSMFEMFSGCTNLNSIYVSETWSTARITSLEVGHDMFTGCTSLVGGAGTTYDAEHTDYTYARIDGGTSNPGYFTDKNAPTSYNIMVKVVGNGEVMAGQTTVMGGNEQEVTVLAGDSLQMYFFPAHDWTLGSLKVDDADVTSEVTRNPETGTLQYLLTVSGSHSVNVTFTEAIPEAYAVLTDNQDVISQGATGITYGKTLTFYYDTNKSSHSGAMSVGPFVEHSDREWNNVVNYITSVVFDESFANYTALTSTAQWFSGCSYLSSISGINNLKTDNVTDMHDMFVGCNFTTLDLSSFNTSNVTNMGYMFSGCSNMTSIDLSSFNTVKVASMNSMFHGCYALKTIYVGSEWTTSNVTESSEMFYGCSNLVGGAGTTYNANKIDYTYAHIDGGENNPGYFTDKNAPASYVITVTSYGNGQVSVEGVPEVVEDGKKAEVAVTAGGSLEMFFFPGEGYQLDSLMVDGINVTADVVPATEQSAASYTLNNINAVHNVITYFGEKASYNEAYAVLVSENNKVSLTLYYDGNKSRHSEGLAIGLDEMMTSQQFLGNREYIQEVTIDSSFVHCELTATISMFAEFSALTTINDLKYLKTDKVMNMWRMFYACPKLTSLDVSGFNTANVTNMEAMFEGCSSLASLDVSGFNTANVTTMQRMFMGCRALETIDVSHFNTEKVTDMGSMFESCGALRSIDVSHFNTANVTNMGNMFVNCAGLTSLDVTNFNTSNVTNLFSTFSGCTGLTTLDLSSFNTAKVTDMDKTFLNCSALTTIYAGSEWTTASVTDGSDPFAYCTRLVGGKGTTYSADHWDYTYARIDGGPNSTTPGYFTDKNAPITVAAPEFRFEGDNLTMTTETQNAGIFYKVADLPSMDDAVVASVVNSLIVTADGQSTYYDQPFELKKAAVVKAIAIIRNETATFVSDTTTMVYDYEAWVNLKSAVESGVDLYGRAQGNPNVDTQLLEQLQWALNEGDMIYKNRAQMDSFEAKHFTQRINELCAQIEAQMTPTEQVATPYFRMESYYNNEVAIKTDTDEAEIYYTQNSRMIQGNDTDFGNGTWNLNWKVSGSNASYQVTSGGYNNTYCLKLTSATASTFGSAQAGYKFVNALTKDTYYTLRFKARSESGRGQLQVFCQNDTIDNTRSTVDTLAIGSELTDYEVTFKIKNENTNQVVLNFGAVADTYYIDNVLFGAVVSDTTNQMRTRYEQPINLREGATIKAVATKQGMLDSSPAVLDYFYDGWMNLRDVYEMAKAITYDCYGDPNVPLQMVQEVEVRVADRYSRLWDRRGREHVDDTELMDTYDELRYILDDLYRMKSGFTVDGVSYHAVDSTQVEVIPSLESYYRGAITVPATVNYNNINFRVTTVAQNAFRSEYLTAIIWNAGFALTATDLQSSQNPNLLLFVTEASMAPTDRDNVVINGFAKNIRLSEGGNFYCPQAFSAEAISYTREFKQQTQIGVSRGWETIALPFTVQTITHEQRGVIAPFGNTASNTHFWLRRLTSNGLQAVPTIEANTAYLISMPNSEEYIADYNLSGHVTFSAENATVPMTEVVKDESADYVMTPCFTNAAAKQGIYVLNVGEQRSGYPEGSIFESNYRAVLPFQAYVEHKGSNPAPPYFIVGDLGGDTTGIDATLVNSERVNSEAWYTLDGRKLQGKPTQKGVYITNGKKVIIK